MSAPVDSHPDCPRRVHAPPGTRFCPACGAAFHDSARFCANCEQERPHDSDPAATLTRHPAPSPGYAPSRSPRAWLRWATQALGLIAVFAVAALAVVYGEQLHQRFEGLGYLTVFAITLVAAATVILPAPGAVSVAAFGAALNPWLVGLVAATGQTCGELTGYYLGWSGRGVLHNVRGYATIQRWMHRHGMLTLFVLAMIPNPIFDIAGMIAGASRFGVIRFIAASWPGRAIKNIGFAFAGSFGVDLFLTTLGG